MSARQAERTGDGGPPPAEIERRLAAAQEMAQAAGELLLGYFRGELETRIKARGSTVSNADHAAEQQLRQRIDHSFPGDSVLGEEFGFDARGDDWCWTLDPLDGTHNFVAGIGVFCVAVGVLHRGAPLVGVIHDPIGGETYVAARGQGAHRNGDALRVRPGPLDRLSMIAVRHRFMRGPRGRLCESLPTRKFRCLGSICLELAHVAAGGLSAAIAASARLWEAVPASLLVIEAGGEMRDAAGARLFPLTDTVAEVGDRSFRLLAGNPQVVAELGARLAGLPHGGER